MTAIFHKSRSSLLPNYSERCGTVKPWSEAEKVDIEAHFPGFFSKDGLTRARAALAYREARRFGRYPVKTSETK